jgi:hypothetical protein
MKRVFSLQNRVMVISALLGLLFSASSFTIGPDPDFQPIDKVPQKKVQRLKVIVNKDGKETKIDTTFNLSDEKVVQLKVDSILKNFDVAGLGPDHSKIIILRDGKRMEWINEGKNCLPGEKQFDILIQSCDSGKANKERRIFRIGKDGNFSSFDGKGMFSPPPPALPRSSVLLHRQLVGDPYAFDTKDESVISYEKKDIGNGLERITIVRKKKAEKNENKEVKVTVETSDDSKK